jgi:PKHD-type hydroxylase
MIRYILNKVENFQAVLSVDNFFTEKELERITSQLSNVESKAAIAGWNKPIVSDSDMDEAVSNSHTARKSNVYWLDDKKYDWIYDKLQIAINHVNLTNYNKVLYGIESLQYTEYDSKYNGFYGPHTDCIEEQLPLIRSLSFSVQISKPEDYVGGDVRIYYNDQVLVANKTYGSITFFDSKILHEVTPVTSGFRKSLVGWIHGPRV